MLGLGSLLLFASGVLVGSRTSTQHEQKLLSQLTENEQRRENHNQYTFISPLLACIFPESIELKEYSTLEKTIQTRLDDLKDQGQIDTMSYYFRNLEDGRWVGIDEMSKFEPASLFKVPIMMAYYKAAEEHPEVLTEKITYTKEHNSGSLIVSDQLKLGNSYTINELINLMITESDNVALSMLNANLDYAVLRELFVDLGIDYPGDPSSGIYTISPREYSLFFRVLYNGTYLSNTYSETALKLLSQATFEHGLDAGLPTDVTISHKFGERGIYSDTGDIAGYELHDCGIVYGPTGDYFLCVFTSGKDIDGLADAIRQVSEISYTEAQYITAE